MWGAEKETLFKGLGEIYPFATVYLFYSFCNTEEEIIDLKRLYLCYLMFFEGSNNPYIDIQNRLWNFVFLRIRERSSLSEFDLEENSKERAEAMEKSIHELEVEFVYLIL